MILSSMDQKYLLKMDLLDPVKGIMGLGWRIAMILNLVGQYLNLVLDQFCLFGLNLFCVFSFLKSFCFNASRFVDEAVSSKGYVTFSLTNGPEYHVSQVSFKSFCLLFVSMLFNFYHHHL